DSQEFDARTWWERSPNKIGSGNRPGGTTSRERHTGCGPTARQYSFWVRQRSMASSHIPAEAYRRPSTGPGETGSAPESRMASMKPLLPQIRTLWDGASSGLVLGLRFAVPRRRDNGGFKSDDSYRATVFGSGP